MNWAFLDPDHARAQARAADEWRLSGQPTGSLHGVPVGLKDIIDTADMPTENGSVLHAGRTPSRDAAVVARLRAAGAVIMGKTVTTEFATAFPGKTRNPHSPEHTSGGSSSGSAAAVAAGMVPLALGSQTGGSVIRPAAFCGVYGFKPTHGLIPRTGMWAPSRSLDHVGLFARSVEDLALLAEPVMGHDEGDPDTRPRARIAFRDVAAQEPPVTPMLAFVKTPRWGAAADETKAAFTELVERLGDRVEELELAGAATEAWYWHRTIMEAEMAANLEREWERGRDHLSESLRTRITRGRQVLALDYQRAALGQVENGTDLTALSAGKADAMVLTLSDVQVFLGVNGDLDNTTTPLVWSDASVVNGTLGFGATLNELTLVSIKDLGANKTPTVVSDDVSYLALALNDLNLDLIGLEALLEFHGYNVDVLLNKAADAFPATALETKLDWSGFGTHAAGGYLGLDFDAQLTALNATDLGPLDENVDLKGQFVGIAGDGAFDIVDSREGLAELLLLLGAMRTPICAVHPGALGCQALGQRQNGIA